MLQIGLSEAAVLLRKIGSFGDPRLYALQLVTDQLSHSSQPLVPERVFLSGGDDGAGVNPSSGMLGMLIQLMVAEKSGFTPSEAAGIDSLREFSERMTREAMESMQQASAAVRSETPRTEHAKN